MFWNNYVRLCEKAGKKPNVVAAELGFSSGSVTAWKQGRLPRGGTIDVIAGYFGVTPTYLLNDNEKTAPDSTTTDPAILELAEIAETLSKTESGIARLNLLLEEARRLQEYEKKLAELEAQHSQQNQNTTGTV